MTLPSDFPMHQAINRTPLNVDGTTSVTTVLALIAGQHADYALVSDEQRLVGIFTHRDLVRLVATARPLTALTIADVMTRNLICLEDPVTQDLLEVLAKMRQHRIRHFPVVTSTGACCGIITQESLREFLNPVDLLRFRRVREVMSTAVVSALAESSALAITQLMHEHRVSCVVVTTQEPNLMVKPIGIVTERDIAQLSLRGIDLGTTAAAAIMSAPLTLLQPEETLWNAHEIMKAKGLQRLVVVDAVGALAGIVTQTSVLSIVDPMEAHMTITTLQKIVDARTSSLQHANEQLQRQILERKRAKAALQKQMVRERLINRIAQRIRQSLDLLEILTMAVTEVRQFLQVDRVLIYQFQPYESGTIAVESVNANVPLLKDLSWGDEAQPLFSAEFYRSGRIHSIPDLAAPRPEETQHQNLSDLGIQANLVVPIGEHERLWGLLVVNECSAPRRWEQLEINLLQQLSNQLVIAIHQSGLYQQLQVANQELKQLASMDGLTQLSNRRRFDECLALEWERLVREQQPLTLIMCDVDHFKRYNDAYGHLGGDACLRQVAQAIQVSVKRPADIAARYGGEEFAVILPNTDAQGGMNVARHIQAHIKDLKLPHSHSLTDDFVTLSLGVACVIPTLSMSPNTLIEAADGALYQAKAAGRNQFILSQELIG